MKCSFNGRSQLLGMFVNRGPTVTVGITYSRVSTWGSYSWCRVDGVLEVLYRSVVPSDAVKPFSNAGFIVSDEWVNNLNNVSIAITTVGRKTWHSYNKASYYRSTAITALHIDLWITDTDTRYLRSVLYREVDFKHE